jgi:CRISPR-associated protein Cas1
MEVEGIHIASEDTVAGIAKHKRVDKPSQTTPTQIESEHKATHRSLVLTSERLGLTATIDLVEQAGSTAVPIEYRKGSPKKSSGDGPSAKLQETEDQESLVAWPTDRIQVGLQAILLEENGYRVERCQLYYFGTNQKIDILFDNQLRSESLATLEAAKAAAEGPRPLPLINDSRCPRCSLNAICLPDELALESTGVKSTDDPAIRERLRRKLWPSCDEGQHVIVQTTGSRIGVTGQSLNVKDSNGKKLEEIPLAGVESIAVVGNVQVSTQAITTLADRDIGIAYLTAAGRMVAWMDPMTSVSAAVRKAQVQIFENMEKRVELAKQLVIAKIKNQRTLLQRNASNLPGAAADAMTELAKRAERSTDIDSIRGFEGQAAALYFANFAQMIPGEMGVTFDANGRQRRPPPDPINATLSFAYTMLAHECTTALRLARLEPTIGAFHSSRPGRPALSLDLMEPFRPLIADSIALTAFNRDELRPGHFIQTASGSMMTDHGRRAFFSVYGRRMDDEVTHPVFGYKLTYRRMIHLHARMIAAWILGEAPKLSFLTTR